MHKIETILTPIDFSENALKISQAAAYVAGTFKAKLHLIFVIREFDDYSSFFVPPVNMPNLKEEILLSAQQQMDTFTDQKKKEFADAGVPEVKSAVLNGDVAEEIINYAKVNNCDLIVMGTHGYKGFERIMFGSVAEKVVKNACCPVMTINPYQEECEKQ